MRTARQILADARTIAVVGASRDPLKPAHWVPEALRRFGWRVVPVNPHADRLLGERAYARLADIPVHVDVVNVFRPAEDAPQLVRAAAAMGAGAVWLQQGIASPLARRLAREAGLDYIEDTCIGAERALAQMVAGGITPPSPVYHGIRPHPQRRMRRMVRHHLVDRTGAEVPAHAAATAVSSTTALLSPLPAASWCTPSHRAHAGHGRRPARRRARGRAAAVRRVRTVRLPA